MLKITLLIVFVGVFSGCASTGNLYNPSGLEYSNLAQVHSSSIGSGDWKIAPLNASILNVSDNLGNIIISRPMGDRYTTVTLAPGVYRFQVYCSRARLYYEPEVEVSIEAGVSYVAVCEGAGEKNGFGWEKRMYAVILSEESAKNIERLKVVKDSKKPQPVQ